MKNKTHFWQYLHSFFVIGINYRLSDVNFRSRYSLSEQQSITIYNKLKGFKSNEIFIISTCNRTELYCFNQALPHILKTWCDEANGDLNELKKHIYYKQGEDAVKHLCKVVSGLDSQILGDYEISSQIKKAFALAKIVNATGTYCEKLVNTAQQMSKRIRTETQITQGSVSTSHFAVKYIHDYMLEHPEANILLLGTGKIGINTIKGLKEYIDPEKICLMNRTESKAIEISETYRMHYRPFDMLDESVNHSDIIIVATNAPEPVVRQKQFTTLKKRLIIDLSIPSNVDEVAKTNSYNSFLNIDELSKYTDETLHMRWKDIPEALQIINEGVEQFNAWLKERTGFSRVEHIKLNILNFHQQFGSCMIREQKIATRCKEFFVKEVKTQTDHGCRHIALVNELLDYTAN
ncbi:MAG: glutamyl-tRNA reductase [Bacteroidia bacterium]